MSKTIRKQNQQTWKKHANTFLKLSRNNLRERISRPSSTSCLQAHSASDIEVFRGVQRIKHVKKWCWTIWIELRDFHRVTRRWCFKCQSNMHCVTRTSTWVLLKYATYVYVTRSSTSIEISERRDTWYVSNETSRLRATIWKHQHVSRKIDMVYVDYIDTYRNIDTTEM